MNERPADGLTLVARTAQLAQFLTEDVVLDPGRQAGVISGRDRLLALASRAPNGGGAFHVDFVDLSVAINGDQAQAHLTAALSSTDARTGEPNVDAREVDLTLVKRDDWRIQRIVLVDVLERPPS